MPMSCRWPYSVAVTHPDRRIRAGNIQSLPSRQRGYLLGTADTWLRQVMTPGTGQEPRFQPRHGLSKHQVQEREHEKAHVPTVRSATTSPPHLLLPPSPLPRNQRLAASGTAPPYILSRAYLRSTVGTSPAVGFEGTGLYAGGTPPAARTLLSRGIRMVSNFQRRDLHQNARSSGFGQSPIELRVPGALIGPRYSIILVPRTPQVIPGHLQLSRHSQSERNRWGRNAPQRLHSVMR